jgi:predicted RNase H-like HicB family nuclease
MSTPSIQVQIKLEPVIQKDEESGLFVARFKAFPQAVAYDDTEKKALVRLFELFQVMLRNEKEQIIEQILQEQNLSFDLNMVTA